MITTTSRDREERDQHDSTQIELILHQSSTQTSSQVRSTKNHWRQILLIFRAHVRLKYSITHNRKNKSVDDHPGFTSDESDPSYTALPDHNDDNGDASAQLEIRLDIHNINTINNDSDINDNSSIRSSNNNNNSDINDNSSIRSSSNNNNSDINDNSSSENDADNVVPRRTSINNETLSNILKEKNLVSLSELGGVERVAAALGTNLENGICNDAEDLHCRRVEFGVNTYKEITMGTTPPSKSFFYFVFKTSKDWTIVLLFICGALSLGSGIKEEGLKNGWYDGTTIFITIFILVAATSIKEYFLWRKSQKLINENKLVTTVLREGRPQLISASDVVVGDVVLLKIGDRVPVDGLLIHGENLKVGDDILHHESRIVDVENPFLYNGGKVIEGSAQMLVTSVGTNTVWSEIMSTVNHDTRKHTLLQVRVDKLNTYLQNIGMSLTVLMLVVLLLRFLMGKKDDETGYPDQIGKRTAVGELMKAVQRFLTKPRGITASITAVLAVLLVGIQEGLPLMITLSLSYWSRRMLNNQAIIHELCGCVTMSYVTTICTDKTAELMLDQVEVDMFWIGEEAIGGDIVSVISQNVLEAIRDGVGTPVLVCDNSSSPIKDPLLPWAESNLGMNMELLKQSRTVLFAKSFCSERKRSGFLMRKNGDAEKAIHLHWKGSAETILDMCSDYYNSNGVTKSMDEGKRAVFQQVIEDMATKGLQSIAFAHRLIEEDDGDTEDNVRKLHEDGLILLGLLGVKYTCCSEARSRVDAVLHAGVSIKLVSPESLSVLSTIAIECGILRPDQDLNGMVLDAEEFRKLSEADRMKRVDQITVMGNSLPSDKLLFVKSLRQKGEVVAVTGATASDSPALKEAYVGILMGAPNSEIAKESSDILILNGSLASIFNVLLLGRCAYQNIRKFIQLELTINISGLLITFVTTVSLGDSPITPLQLFMVNLMVGTLAALALLIEPPTDELLKMPPVSQTEPLITKAMWRNIVIQVSYQAMVLLIFQFKGQTLPGMNRNLTKTMIFNGFVLCQVFNQFNARDPENRNVFKGILGSHWFLVAVGAPLVLQAVVVEFATTLVGTTRLNWVQWLACILFGIMSWPIDYAVKCISGFFTNRSIGLTTCLKNLLVQTPGLSTPLSSKCQLPIPLIRE